MEKRKARLTPKRPVPPGLVAGYRPVNGVPDEMFDPEGNIRPGWAPLLAAFDRMGAAEMTARFERADQYLRDAGVFYRKYDGAEGKERAWPLSHVPLIIAESDWQQLAAGLMQRAELLEQLVADIYGAQTLVARGLLPPADAGSLSAALVGVAFELAEQVKVGADVGQTTQFATALFMGGMTALPKP